MAPSFKDMSTWAGRIGHDRLRSFTAKDGSFWLEQNATKKTKWAKLTREGNDVAWEFAGRGGKYTGRMLIDGEIYTPAGRGDKEVLKTGG